MGQAVALAVLVAGSLVLRTGALHAGYWIDEGIAVGIASHPLGEIPGLLRMDGSPPLYYVLLHRWMRLAGTGEAATRLPSLAAAVACVPAAWWAGRAVAGRRTGLLAAAGAAGCPFLTTYAQETRMYALVALLSLLASGSFVLAFVRGRRRHVVLLGVWLVLLLYTHTWGPFLVGGMLVAWWWLWRRGRVRGRDGAFLAAGLALAFAPWVPTLLFQAAHTGAPWAQRPSMLLLLIVPASLLGAVAAPVLAIAVALAPRPRPAEPVLALLVVLAASALAAWAWSQFDPAWSRRYLALLLGPLLLVVAALLARAPRVWPLAVVAVIWALSGAPQEKSDVRAVAADAGPALRPGDVVLSTQPEQVPVLAHYLPAGVRYSTPLGAVRDPSVVDWRDALSRADGRIPRVGGGRRVLLVTPVSSTPPRSPWERMVRARTREWRAALRADPAARRILVTPDAAPSGLRSAVRAELFEVAGCDHDAPCPAHPEVHRDVGHRRARPGERELRRGV